MQGEFDLKFTDKMLNSTDPMGHTNSYDVVYPKETGGNRFWLENNGTKVGCSFNRVANLKYVTGVGISTYNNETFPDSFAQGLKSNYTTNYVVFQCNIWGSKQDCDFEMKQIAKSFQPKEEKNLIGAIFDDDKCSRCDVATNKCLPCNCGSGGGCGPAASCESMCIPKGQRFKCDWHQGPQCLANDAGS